MTIKKESSIKKITHSKAKKAPAKKTAVNRPTTKTKKPAAKKISAQHFEDILTKEALKLVDEAATLLRSGIKNSQKTTSKAREATHKKAHGLLGKATCHLDDVLKSGSSFLHKAISKL